MICLWIIRSHREVGMIQLLLQEWQPVMCLIGHLLNAGRLGACAGAVVEHGHLEVSALKLLYLLTEVLIRCDEDHKVLRPTVHL